MLKQDTELILSVEEKGKFVFLTSDKEEIIYDVLKTLSQDKKGFFITPKYTYRSFEGIMENEGIKKKNVIFLDFTTSFAGGNTMQTASCHYLRNPGYLLEAQVEIEKKIKEVDFIIIFGVESFLIYNTKQRVENFLRELKAKIQAAQIYGLAFSSGGRETEEIIRAVSDKIINLD